MNYAEGHRRLQKFFAARRVPPAVREDLAQDVWVRWLSACERGTLKKTGLHPLRAIAERVLAGRATRPERFEVPQSDFEPNVRPAQLQTDEPRSARHRAQLAREERILADHEAGVPFLALRKQYRIPDAKLRRILEVA